MIKLSRPEIGSEELEEIKKVLESKNLVQGEKVEKFEELVGNYLNSKFCIAVTSGTAALHLALLSLNMEAGDEVIVPDFTFPATANVVELIGGKVKLVDIKLDGLCIDTDKIEEVISEKTRVILPVHEFGQCSNMDRIMKLANRYNLKVIEDAACALGSDYKGIKAGTIGNMGCFSFHPRKAITTGEGGMIVTNDEELALRLKTLRNHGISYLNGKTDFITPGLNYRMTDIQAAMGIVQMKKLEKMIDLRRCIAIDYNKLLGSASNIVLPFEMNYGKHIYQTYHILIDKKISRDYIKEELKEKGIECNIGAYAVHEQYYYKKKYKLNDDIFTNSMAAYSQGLALPMYSELTSENLQYICETIKAILRS